MGAFSSLSEKLSHVFSKLRNKGKLTELEVDNATNSFKAPNLSDNIKTLENKIDALYKIITSKNEVLKNEQQ